MSGAVRMAEFARIAGVNRSTVTRWRQAGRLAMDDHGRVLVDESLARIQATVGGRTDVAERHATERGAELPTSPATQGQPDATAGQGEATAGGNRKDWKRLALYYENQGIRLERSLRRYERYNRAAVRRELEAIGGTLRAAAERLVDEVAPQARIASPAERRRLLERQEQQIRRVLRSELARALYRLRADARGAR